MVSGYKPFKVIKNVKEIVVEDSNIDVILNSAFDRPESAILNLISKTPQMCSDAISQKKVQALKNEQFDLIILSFFMNFCCLSFVHHFQVRTNY